MPAMIRAKESYRASLAFLVVFLLSSLLTVGYLSRRPSVRIYLDGQVITVHTRQRQVGAVLREAGIALRPEDLVEPPREAPLGPERTIRIQRARAVTLEADGERWQFYTHQRTPQAILAEAGLTLGPYDRLIVNPTSPIGTSSPGDDPFPTHLIVRRAVPVTVHRSGAPPLTLQTTATTVGEALRQAGITLYLADSVRPPLSAPVQAGTHIYLDLSVPVTIQVDGRQIRTRTHRKTVGEVLADLRITLQGLDYTVPPLDTPLGAGQTIRVVRVQEDVLVQQEPIPFETTWQPDPELELDQQRLAQEGQPGVYEQRIRVRYENGQEVSRTVESERVIRPPQPRVYSYGTKIVVRTLETPEGPVEYWRVIRMLATSYTAATSGKSRDHPRYGITATGLKMRKGIVAVDPRVISLGSRVYVPGYGIGLAADTGGAIKGRRIDLGYDEDNLVLWYRWVDVYLLTPVPDKIRYVLRP
ncbi:MAG: DUF348 domain-containing protein [Chloroflexi bacterium]|nr:MAG: DUF348 domain-containing protein [Chloroflexota bacterium]